jgi:hypothetical protein
VKRARIEIASEWLPAPRDPRRHLVVEIARVRVIYGVRRVSRTRPRRRRGSRQAPRAFRRLLPLSDRA